MKEMTEKTNTTVAAKAPKLYSIVCGMELWSACWRIPATSAAMTPSRNAITVSRMRIVGEYVAGGVVKAPPPCQFAISSPLVRPSVSSVRKSFAVSASVR
jgi:hypothetical protein